MPKLKKKKKKSFLTKVQSWSDAMEDAFNRTVSMPVLNHKESNVKKNTYFGFPYQVLRDEVIEVGRGDFNSDFEHDDYGTVSTEQMAQFYCFANMKGHFYSAYVNFWLSKGYLEDLFEDYENVVLVDIGCGPGTAGLALSDLFPNKSFDYYGVDRATAMCDQAQVMFRHGRREGAVNHRTTTTFEDSWVDVPRQFGCDTAVIINFSYFFASPFLTRAAIRGLASFYKSINKFAQNRVVISYTNSHHDFAATSYKRFVAELGLDYDEKPPVQKTVHYRLSRKRRTEGKETFKREIYEIEWVSV